VVPLDWNSAEHATVEMRNIPAALSAVGAQQNPANSATPQGLASAIGIMGGGNASPTGCRSRPENSGPVAAVPVRRGARVFVSE